MNSLRRWSMAAALLTSMVLAGCASSSDSAAPSTPSTTTTTTAAPTTTSSTTTTTAAPTTTTTTVPLPEWVEALPFEVSSAGSVPDALAFTDVYEDPGLHYRLSTNPDWVEAKFEGSSEAPLTIWEPAADVEVIVGSAPIGGASLNDLIEASTFDEIFFSDENLAVGMRSSGHLDAIMLLIYSVDRVAMASVTAPPDKIEAAFNDALPYLLTLERTPYGTSETGGASEAGIAYWRGQFDTMTPEDRAAYGDLDQISTCIADGFASERLDRYGNFNPALVDRSDEVAVMMAGNYQADIAEVLTFCELPLDTLGTWNSDATYEEDFIEERALEALAEEFPIAWQQMNGQDIDPAELGDAMCQAVETNIILDDAEAALLALEPAGFMGPNEDYAQLTGVLMGWRCLDTVNELIARTIE